MIRRLILDAAAFLGRMQGIIKHAPSRNKRWLRIYVSGAAVSLLVIWVQPESPVGHLLWVFCSFSLLLELTLLWGMFLGVRAAAGSAEEAPPESERLNLAPMEFAINGGWLPDQLIHLVVQETVRELMVGQGNHMAMVTRERVGNCRLQMAREWFAYEHCYPD